MMNKTWIMNVMWVLVPQPLPLCFAREGEHVIAVGAGVAASVGVAARVELDEEAGQHKLSIKEYNNLPNPAATVVPRPHEAGTDEGIVPPTPTVTGQRPLAAAVNANAVGAAVHHPYAGSGSRDGQAIVDDARHVRLPGAVEDHDWDRGGPRLVLVPPLHELPGAVRVDDVLHPADAVPGVGLAERSDDPPLEVRPVALWVEFADYRWRDPMVQQVPG
mmetsp:Transcript_99718/g.171740  ORF Transcript_99718/g.171740 Transcript_99718/m.171740 type:complete len:218 (-) Transcript_99718:479-1132(-)